MKNQSDFLIIGGGISGLSLAYFLSKAGKQVTVIEKNNYLGGTSSSFEHNDFILDIGPHKLFSQLPGIMPLFKEILEDPLEIKKRNSIYLLGKYFSFPLQISNLIKNINPQLIYSGIKTGISTTSTFIPRRKKPQNFEEHFIQGFGKGLYQLMFEGYAKKVWGDPKELSIDVAKKRIPIESIPKFITQVFNKEKKKKISAEYFYYPKKGIVELPNKLAKIIKKNNGEIILNAKIDNIITKENKVEQIIIKKDKKSIKLEAEHIISTINLAELIKLLDIQNPEIRTATKELKYSDLVLVYVFLNKERALKDNWIFFPGQEIIFNRVSEQKSFSKFTCPEDKTVICAEVTIPLNSNLNHLTEQEIYEKVKNDLIKTGLISEEEIYNHLIRKEKNIYPVYNLNYKENLNLLLTEINKIKNLVTAGRPGLFNYNNIDHCIDMASKISDYLLNKENTWDELMNQFDEYKIVD